MPDDIYLVNSGKKIMQSFAGHILHRNKNKSTCYRKGKLNSNNQDNNLNNISEITIL